VLNPSLQCLNEINHLLRRILSAWVRVFIEGNTMILRPRVDADSRRDGEGDTSEPSGHVGVGGEGDTSEPSAHVGVSGEREAKRRDKRAKGANRRDSTGRQKMVLERWTTPKLSRRSWSPRYGVQSCRRKSAGVAKRSRELIPPHPKSLTVRFATFPSMYVQRRHLLRPATKSRYRKATYTLTHLGPPPSPTLTLGLNRTGLAASVTPIQAQRQLPISGSIRGFN
jgi:hypothetical protein